MNLESQVVSLPLAKRLKELGVKQESFFVWVPWIETPRLREDYRPPAPRPFDMDLVAAFTVAELGEMLPESIGLEDGHAHLHIAYGTRQVGKWTVGYASFRRSETDLYDEEKEADARAKMLIYLIEKGLTKP